MPTPLQKDCCVFIVLSLSKEKRHLLEFTSDVRDRDAILLEITRSHTGRVPKWVKPGNRPNGNA